MMSFREWLGWMEEDYEYRGKEFNFTEEELDKMYRKYVESFLED